jgi:lipoprotein NlpI
MLTGSMTPDELLKILEQKAGDDREMALSEGYFYLGQHYRARGDNVRAAEYFEKAFQQQVVIYLEHNASKHELAQIKKAH